MNKNVLRWRLNVCVERSCLRSVGSLFHARGAATQNYLSPNFRLVRGSMKSPRLAVRRAGRPDTSAADTQCQDIVSVKDWRQWKHLIFYYWWQPVFMYFGQLSVPHGRFCPVLWTNKLIDWLIEPTDLPQKRNNAKMRLLRRLHFSSLHHLSWPPGNCHQHLCYDLVSSLCVLETSRLTFLIYHAVTRDEWYYI